MLGYLIKIGLIYGLFWFLYRVFFGKKLPGKNGSFNKTKTDKKSRYKAKNASDAKFEDVD